MSILSVKAKKLLSGFVALATLLAVSANSGFAADCKALVESIRKEMSLVKKKDRLQEGVKLCPNDPEMNYMYGYALERLRKYDEAIKYYNVATGLDKKYAKAFFSIGDVYMVLDKVDNAVGAYEKGLSIEPDDRRAAKSLESARIKMKALRGESVSTEEAVTVVLAEKSKERELTPLEAIILRLLVLFPGREAQLPEEAADQLSLVAARALMNPDLKNAVFEVAGNTDDSGDAAKDQALSKKRAEAVRNFLVKNFDIKANRLQVAAYGHTRPIVPNTTEQNRMMNNRVEFKRLK